MNTGRDTGLVLEGGGLRGVFTAGVLDYLMEQDVCFPYVVGASAGACNAVDYVSEQIGRTKECMIPSSKEYQCVSFKKSLKTKSLFDMDLMFDKLPNELLPFEYETFFDSEIHCELVVTNCVTGQAEYLSEKASKERLMKICRASSSIPLVSPIVTLDGGQYLDGGLADSIPLRRALKTGHRKNVVVLTRNRGYRKRPPRKSRAFYMTLYKEYPNLVKTIFARAERYNRLLEHIEKWEDEGKIFVIRPTMPTVSRAERNQEHLEEFYRHGYQSMEERFEEMQRFLTENTKKRG